MVGASQGAVWCAQGAAVVAAGACWLTFALLFGVYAGVCLFADLRHMQNIGMQFPFVNLGTGEIRWTGECHNTRKMRY